MAIKVLNRGNNTSTDLTLLYNFLLENQSSTFLRDMTIEYGGSSGDPLTITSTNGSKSSIFKIQLKSASLSSQEVIRYTTNGLYWTTSTYAASGTRYSGCFLKAAILCNNGFILHLRGLNNSAYQSSGYTETTGIAVTIDNHDQISIIRTHQYLPSDTSFTLQDEYWSTISSTSTTSNSILIKPRYISNRTCLSPLASAADDPDEYLPYAYVATATQLASEGITAVRINNVDYITNGMWYIRDTPIE